VFADDDYVVFLTKKILNDVEAPATCMFVKAEII
jgi:hypothetical protein